MHARELKMLAKRTNACLPLRPVAMRRPYFTDAERAALALTGNVARLSDRADAVPDEVWNKAARHYDEPALASLILCIAVINVWNRLNVSTRQVAGEWVKPAEGQAWLETHASSLY